MPGSLHVLLAEDEDLVALVVAEILEGDGFRVTVARNGVEAVEADAGDPADILITDMRMPVMDGAALIRSIREHRPDLPITVVSGFSEDLPLPEPGHLVVMRKPYDTAAMAPTISALLSGRAGA
ncbi:response regulator (plasmid) [Azospirillum sp. A26]|uniref:response regulator n=1 Tax=Azospirillum sp. A26 TaxID=3160607 RepID=UPI003673022A